MPTNHNIQVPITNGMHHPVQTGTSVVSTLRSSRANLLLSVVAYPSRADCGRERKHCTIYRTGPNSTTMKGNSMLCATNSRQQACWPYQGIWVGLGAEGEVVPSPVRLKTWQAHCTQRGAMF